MVEKRNNKILPDATEYTAAEKTFQEGLKLYFEIMKHLTTLCTGSILIIATFLEKLFAAPKWKPFIAVSLASFIFSIVGSISTMTHLAYHITNFTKPGEDRAKEGLPIFYFSLVSFVVGILCLITFTLKNLF